MTDRPATVRLAEPADDDALYDLLMALADEGCFEYDEQRIRTYIRMGTQHDGGAHGIIDGDGCIAGSIGIIWDRTWWSADYQLGQLWLFVRPKYRRSRYADDLMNWGKWFREQVEAGAGHKISLISSVISVNHLDMKLRWWRRHCGKMVGGIFEIR